MFKILIKFSLVMALFVGIGMSLDMPKVSAAAVNCNWAPGSNWGNHDGPGQGAMAALQVYARDQNGNPLNVSYNIKSEMPNASAPGNNERIYQWDVGTSHLKSPINKSASKWFSTGEYLNGNGGAQCNGWSVIGAGFSGHVGNGWVLDCGAGHNSANFWIDSVTRPAGAGNGRWVMTGTDIGGTIDDVNNEAPFRKKFQASNGGTQRINLVWVDEDWTLGAETTVNKTTANRGDQVTFKHSVTNYGAWNARYGWRIVEENETNQTTGWTARADGSPDNVGVNQKQPDRREVNVTIPNTANNGDEICQRIDYSNRDGPNTTQFPNNFANSQKECVTVYVPPDPPTVSCTGARVENGGNWWGQKKRTKVEINNVRVTGIKENGGSNTAQNFTDINGWVPNDTNTAGPNVNHSRQWFYTPTANSINYTITTQSLDASNRWQTRDTQTDTIDCFTATCTFLATGSVVGTGPGGKALKGGKVRLKGTLRNTSPNNATLWGSGIRVTGSRVPTNNRTFVVAPSSDQILANQTRSFDQEFDVPDDGFTDNFTFTPQYLGGASGPTCIASVIIYEQKTIVYTPVLRLSDDESPETVISSSKIKNNFSQPINLPTTHTVYKKVPGSAATRTANTNASKVAVDEVTVLAELDRSNDLRTPNNAGDVYCTRIQTNDGSNLIYGGLVDYTGDISEPDYGPLPRPFIEDCKTVVNRPYFKAYGKGVVAGGNFQDNGSCTGGGLLASWYNNKNGNNRGASSQLSALANIKITGYASAQTGANRSPIDLTFANTDSGVADQSSPLLGGEFGAPHCLYEPLPPTAVTAPDSTESNTTNRTIGTTTVTSNQSIFVNGDVYINGDIEFSPLLPATKTSFVLKATGNIYIAPGVKKLDGIYVAKDTIYTCSNSTGTGPRKLTTGGYYTACNNQLRVRGTFIAKKVNLMRTYGSLRNSVNNEQVRNGAVRSGTCANAGPGAPVPSASSCAAEVFDFGPELYLSNPAVQLPNGGTTNYDAITSLPPVL